MYCFKRGRGRNVSFNLCYSLYLVTKSLNDSAQLIGRNYVNVDLNRVTWLTLVVILFNIVQSAELAVFTEDYFNEIIESAEYGGQWIVDAGRI